MPTLYTIKSHFLKAFILLALFFPVSLAQAQQDDLMKDLRALMSELENYDYGQDRTWYADYRELMKKVHTRPDLLPEVEPVMLDLLTSDAGLLAKQFVADELMVYGSSRAVPVLADMLKEKSTGIIALKPLEVIDDPGIDKVLVKAMKKADDDLKTGILITLGNRRSVDALKTMSRELDAGNEGTVLAALYALGELGTPESAELLMSKMSDMDPPLKWDAAEALIRCTELLISERRDAPVGSYYESILSLEPPPTLQYAVIRQQVLQATSGQAAQLKEAISGASPALKELLIPIVRELPAGTNTGVFHEMLPDMEQDHRIQLVLALADRMDPDIHDTAVNMLAEENEAIQLAGLRALHAVGEAGDVPLLAAYAADHRGDLREEARGVLYSLKGEAVDQKLVETLSSSAPDVQEELIRAIGRRNMRQEVERIMEMVGSEDRNVRIEALRVLGEIGSPDDLPELIALSNGLSSRREREAAERMLTRIAEEVPEDEGRSTLFLQMLKPLEDTDTKVLFIHVLGNLGDDEALPVLRDYLGEEETDLSQAAIEALSGWPDASPARDLLQIIKTTEDRKTHALAIRGYVQLLENSDQHGEKEKVRLFREVFGLADNAAEKRMALSGLGTVGHVDALEYAIELMDNPELKAEAKAAVLNIASGAGDRDPAKTRQLLNRILEESQDEDFRKGIREKLEWIDE